MASQAVKEGETYLSGIKRVIISIQADIVASQVDREGAIYLPGI